MSFRGVMVGANNWLHQKLDLRNRFQGLLVYFFPFSLGFFELKFLNFCMIAQILAFHKPTHVQSITFETKHSRPKKS